jgi:CDP-diacylglycerol--serine O-phosphatidyltransferase
MQKDKWILGYWNIANLITLLGLFCALSSCFFAVSDNIKMSVTFLIASGLCDMYDGAVSKKIERTESEKKFGIQLDTVADMVCFGITPAIIVFSMVGIAWFALVIYVFYITCAAVRLAYFNTITVPDKPAKHFQGLPVTCIAWILPIVLFFHSAAASITTLAVVGILFILNIKIPKTQGGWYVLFSAMAAALVILWWLPLTK